MGGHARRYLTALLPGHDQEFLFRGHTLAVGADHGTGQVSRRKGLHCVRHATTAQWDLEPFLVVSWP